MLFWCLLSPWKRACLKFGGNLFPCSCAGKGVTFCFRFDFSDGVDYKKLMASFLTVGFQATNVGLAIEEINRMRNWRLSDVPITDNDDDEFRDMEYRKTVKCTIFFAYTSNMISCGVRETIKFLAKNSMVRPK